MTDLIVIGVDILQDFTSEVPVIDGVGIRFELYSGTCPDIYTDVLKFSAE